MDVSEAVAKRRSIRKFEEGKDVSDADLVSILEAGRAAPSWKNCQPWRFIVVRSQEMRDKLADCLYPKNPADRTLRTASAVIALIAVPEEGEEHEGKAFWLVDCGIAGENMYLQATELGIGSVWVSLLDNEKVCESLGIPAGTECVGLFPLGFPQAGWEDRPRTARKALEEIAYFERYGEPFRPSV